MAQVVEHVPNMHGRPWVQFLEPRKKKIYHGFSTYQGFLQVVEYTNEHNRQDFCH
jgi:hypothetical protein